MAASAAAVMTFADFARTVVPAWIVFYNSVRRHSAIGMLNPDDYEKSLQASAA
jgi:transposase InsO family protein